MNTENKNKIQQLIQQRDKLYQELQKYSLKYHELKNEYKQILDEIWLIENTDP